MGARWYWLLTLAMLTASSAGAQTREELLRACAGLDREGPEAQVSAPVAGWLFGRGIAKTRLGDEAGGSADIAAPQRLEPDIAKQYARYGVKL